MSTSLLFLIMACKAKWFLALFTASLTVFCQPKWYGAPSARTALATAPTVTQKVNQTWSMALIITCILKWLGRTWTPQVTVPLQVWAEHDICKVSQDQGKSIDASCVGTKQVCVVGNTCICVCFKHFNTASQTLPNSTVSKERRKNLAPVALAFSMAWWAMIRVVGWIQTEGSRNILVWHSIMHWEVKRVRWICSCRFKRIPSFPFCSEETCDVIYWFMSCIFEASSSYTSFTCRVYEHIFPGWTHPTFYSQRLPILCPWPRRSSWGETLANS